MNFTAILEQRIAGRCRRGLSRWVRATDVVSMREARGFIYVDDFPKSALDTGGAILRHGRGGNLLCGIWLDRTKILPSDEFFPAGDVE